MWQLTFLAAPEGKQKLVSGSYRKADTNNIYKEKPSCQISPKEVKATEGVQADLGTT